MKKVKDLSQKELKQLLMEEIEVLYPKGGSVPGVHKKYVPDNKPQKHSYNNKRVRGVRDEKRHQQIERYLGDKTIEVEDFYIIHDLVNKGRRLQNTLSGDTYQEPDLRKKELLQLRDGMRENLRKLPAGFHEKWRISPISSLQELSSFLIFLPQLEGNLQDLEQSLQKGSTI